MPHRSLKPIDSTEARIYRIQNVPRSQSIEAEVYRNRSPSKPRSFENRSPSKLRSVESEVHRERGQSKAKSKIGGQLQPEQVDFTSKNSDQRPAPVVYGGPEIIESRVHLPNTHDSRFKPRPDPVPEIAAVREYICNPGGTCHE